MHAGGATLSDSALTPDDEHEVYISGVELAALKKVPVHQPGFAENSSEG